MGLSSAAVPGETPFAPGVWLATRHSRYLEPGKPFDMSKVDRGIAAGLHKAVKEVQIKMAEDFTKLKNDMREDTVYPTAYLDGEGHPLDSANKYVMRFEKDQLPPTNATWSVSQYKGNFYERNVLNRYVIAPWMPLQFNPDGSLDIYLQATSPGKDRESNWLPIPLGQFNLTLRNYFPKQAAYDGTYKVPPVRKVT